MQVHRPFLKKKSELSLVSLAVCTNAARSCSNLLEVALTRGLPVQPIILMAAFTSGLIIVLNIWGGQKSGLLKNATKEMANVQICLNVLKLGEKRWHLAGRLYDILKEIGSLNEQPGPNADHTMSDLSSMKSGHQGLPVSNAPRTSMLPNMTAVQICSPIGATTENDWGLNNHLQSQMGITQANPAVFAVAGYDDRRYVNNDVASQGWVPPSVKGGQFEMFVDEFMDDAPPMYQDGMISADMLSLWSDASAAFSGEEWDAYIANISQTLQAV